MVGGHVYTYTLEVERLFIVFFFSEKTIILVGICNQQFQGTIILMVFDLQGIYIYAYAYFIDIILGLPKPCKGG